MTKIFLLFNNQGAKNQVNSLLLKEQDVELMDSMGELEYVLKQINNFSPDIILI